MQKLQKLQRYRGRVKVFQIIDDESKDHQPVEVIAMKARELGKKSVVVGDLVSVVGDISGTEGTLARSSNSTSPQEFTYSHHR
jgi:hypothetical protein